MNRLKSKWFLVSVIGILWFLFTTGYATFFITIPQNSSQSFEVTKFVFLSISAFGVLFSSLLSSFNSLEATQHINEKIRFDRIENAFKFMERWESDRLVQARDTYRELVKNKHTLSQKEISEKFKSSPELEISIINFFNFMEEIHLSIVAERADEKFLKDAFAGVFMKNCECFFEPFKTYYHNSTTLTHINMLRERWK